MALDMSRCKSLVMERGMCDICGKRNALFRRFQKVPEFATSSIRGRKLV